MGEALEQIEIGLTKLRVAPGDVIMVTCPADWSPEQMHDALEMVAAAATPLRPSVVFALAEGVDVSTLDKEQRWALVRMLFPPGATDSAV